MSQGVSARRWHAVICLTSSGPFAPPHPAVSVVVGQRGSLVAAAIKGPQGGRRRSIYTASVVGRTEFGPAP